LSSGLTKSKPRARFRLLRLAFRFIAWPLLVAVLVFQLRVLHDGGLRLPDFAARELERRLAARGLVFHAEEIRLDPTGRLSLRAVRIGLPGDDTLLISAGAGTLDFKRLALLRGEFEPRRLGVTGLNLVLPARRSLSGADEALLTGGEFLLTRLEVAKPWHLDGASARVLGIATTFRGQIPFDAPKADAAPIAYPIAALVTLLEMSARQAADITRITSRLPLAAVPALEITLAPDRLTVSTDLPNLELNAIPGLPPALAGGTLNDTVLIASVPLLSPSVPDLSAVALRVTAARAVLPSLPAPVGALRADGLSLSVRIDASKLAASVAADLSLHGVEAPSNGVPSLPLVLSGLWVPLADKLNVTLATQLADSPFQFSALLAPLARSASVGAAGELTPALLEVIKPHLPEKARDILTLIDPISLDVAASFDPGAKLRGAAVRMSAGRATARDVSFTRAGGYAVLDGDRLLVSDLFLEQGENAATGSYEMDIKTLAYRFLLSGRLRPMGIEGWFTEWWDRLWANFGFEGGPPEASADIAGTWGQPNLTTVFVAADTARVKVRELSLDRLAVRVWVYEHSTDILGFHAEQGPARADGRVLRVVDLATDEWRRMAFDVTSNLPTESIPQLFGAEGREITAPMRFTTPPTLRLTGEVYGPAAGKDAGRQRYLLDLTTEAPFHFHEFPLDRLAVRIERNDTELALRGIRAGFADGIVNGEAVISGPADARWLAFDANLTNAPTDTVLARWHEFQLSRPAPPRDPAQPPASSQAPAKPPGGVLDLTLVANGPLDDHLAFSGRGTGRITGADLARIKLLGLFSELLNGLGLGFSTLKLSDADARFNLNRRVISFERLYLSGSASPVEARGDYTLPDGELAFTARVLPFDKNGGLLSNTAGLVLAPFASALEVDLAGTFEKPTWTFAYGPRKLLRKITGQFTSPASAPVKPEPAPPLLEAPESPRVPPVLP
jgi:hypothetical protein